MALGKNKERKLRMNIRIWKIKLANCQKSSEQ